MSTLRRVYLNDTKYKRTNLQFCIEKHFMTGFPHSIKKKARNRTGGTYGGGGTDFLYLGQLASMCSSLNDCYPSKSTIGSKYFKAGVNMYENDIVKNIEDKYIFNLYGMDGAGLRHV
jgi:hypothetical protein